MESCDRIMGRPILELSSAAVFLPTDEREQRIAYLRPYGKIKDMAKDSTAVYEKSMVDDMYPKRPATEKFEDMSLYEFVRYYKFQGRPCPAKRTDGVCKKCTRLQGDLGYVHQRGEPGVVVYTRRLTPRMDAEAFFHQVRSIAHCGIMRYF